MKLVLSQNMDNEQLRKIIFSIGSLRYRFLGCYPANFTPKTLPRNSFRIINTDVATSPETHWILIARKGDQFYFGDSLGKNVEHYKNIQYNEPLTHLIDKNIQKMDLCGLYCIYFAYTLYSNCKNFIVDDYCIMRFFFTVLVIHSFSQLYFSNK